MRRRDFSVGTAILLVETVAVLMRALPCLPVTETSFSRVFSAQELEIYSRARSVVRQSYEELIEGYPGLEHTLNFSEDQTALGPLLEEVGKNVEGLFRYLPDTSSEEQVRQQRRGPEGSRPASRRNRFQYLMLTHADEDLHLEEYRTEPDGDPVELSSLQKGYLLTSGFAAQPVHLHPQYQEDSRFRYLGRTSEPSAHLVAFAQIPEKAKQVSLFRLAEREALILVHGLIWVHPSNSQIIRMRTDLLAPRGDLGLFELSTEIEFDEIHFTHTDKTFWLPRSVTVTVVYYHFTFCNRHRYSKHRLFAVETYEKVQPPEI